MQRISKWEEALSEYIESKRSEPFEYGVNDCCTFVFGAIEAITGLDKMLEFRGQYDSAISAAKALREIGFGTLEATVDSKFPVVEIAQAQRGDIAMYDGSLGVVAGSFAWFVSDDGLERINRSMWTKTWRIGRG